MTLVERLHSHLAAAEPYRLAQRADMPSMLTDESKALLREAADAIEKIEAAVAAWSRLQHWGYQPSSDVWRHEMNQMTMAMYELERFTRDKATVARLAQQGEK